MVKPKILVTRKLPPPAYEILSEYCEIELWEKEGPPPKEEIIRRLGDKDALLCLLTDKIDKEVIDAGPKLRVISTYSVGFDHIDVKYATSKGIYIGHTPGVLTDAVADLAFALLLAIARRIVECDNLIRNGEWVVAWAPTFMLGDAVYGKTIGIIGLGKIGSAVARRANGFNMKILYYDKIRRESIEKELNAEFKSLEDLLKESDFVLLSVTLTEETFHLINEDRLKLMKKSTYLINISRGKVIDEKALVKALKENWIRGAALDVFETEPIGKDNPLTKLKNVILTPHVASATNETRSKMAEIAAKNLVNVLKGEDPLFLVNPEVKKIRPLNDVKML